ncbi:excinuclease ABC subunit UvrA [Methanosphaera sp. Vir-13MRS]|uniref:excinuclease ABC subunit UvrA n=1 Tax=Candidatus Methanosphaera massiliense TaxID=3017187 RepID=UPI00238007A3|nr:excinuclease ABC subunit UvrA [Candidatus Methanosphaera massiliense]MDE4078842.1 excinuclease ABC subunit UvrA [Candidatus Methanosphaera massiliense]
MESTDDLRRKAIQDRKIIIKGARQHNLQNIDVTIPRDSFIVITGLSGSGKSSLAFDTIYAEGQRRYVESLSAYARQFLGQMDKPEVDYIEGLSPAISIDQKTTRVNPRSTVGTVTEIYDYLRLLYARIGIPHCYNCGKEISQQTPGQIANEIIDKNDQQKIYILAPVIKDRKGMHKKIFTEYKQKGFVRARVDGEIRSLDEEINLNKNNKHVIEIVIDRLKVTNNENFRKRLVESVETGLKISDGLITVANSDNSIPDQFYSESLACPDCGINFTEISPRMFSFNNPQAACPACNGIGSILEIDPELVVPDRTLSIRDGAIKPWSNSNRTESYYNKILAGLANHYGFKLDSPYHTLPDDVKDAILYGSNGEKITFIFTRGDSERKVTKPFEGVIPHMKRTYIETSSRYRRKAIRNYMTLRDCPTCHGDRLKPEMLAVTINDMNIADLTKLSLVDTKEFFDNLKLTKRQEFIGKEILKEIKERLEFLNNVGLNYLTLARSSGTLSGGEAQRIRLATQIGSRLVGVLYVLDEPSIGLHQRDNMKLINTLKHLRDIGNTLIVVEHDEETILEADHVIDIGPGAGDKGGRLTAQGTPTEIKNNPNSLTGQYLSGAKEIPVPQKRHKGNGKSIKIIGAKENNLKDIDVTFPLGEFICVTGVSGSGKSTLVNEILYHGIYEQLTHKHKHKIGKHTAIEGVENIDKIIVIDQSPIGRTPRSNPATYIGVFTYIRELFAQTPEAKQRGYKPGRFSFNVKGGRCEACCGDGIVKIEMHFLADVYVPCEVCEGKRYNQDTLNIRYKGKNINDVLEMTSEEALEFFENIPKIKRKLQTLVDVGLGYVKLGQPATTLSGGEAQRVKLAKELSRQNTSNTLYILDEPTTGLHFDDINRLLKVLLKLRDQGNTLIVIEHNLDVIKTADHIIDLGPEGGKDGGQLIAEGTPEEVAEKGTYTGIYLKPMLKKSKEN